MPPRNSVGNIPERVDAVKRAAILARDRSHLL
jgi:hypothetical protein